MIEIIIFSIISSFLYHLGTGFLFFLIPLQILFVRKGERGFVNALVITFALIFIIRLFNILRSTEGLSESGPFVLIEIFSVLFLMGGLAFINLWHKPGFYRVLKLLAATGVTGLFCIPLILYLKGSESFAATAQKEFESLSKYFNQIFVRSDNFRLIDAEQLFRPDVLMAITKEFFLRSFLFSYFILLTFSWWIGSISGARSIGKKANITKLISFKLPEIYIWPLIGSLALVLLDTAVELSALGFFAWNICLIFLFLYGLEGIGIIKFLLKKHRLPRGVKWLFLSAFCILLLSPRINIVIFMLIPGLGISEIWVKYRKEERSKE